MKKLVVLVMFMLVVFLGGCSKEYNIVRNLEGRYYYQECVYLNLLSSSTIDSHSELYGEVIYIEFFDNQIMYFGSDETLRTFVSIEYRKEDVNKDLDSLITMDLNGVFDSFDYRYDIYSNNISVGLTIFIKDETIYLAETKMIGGSRDVFTVWSIFLIDK